MASDFKMDKNELLEHVNDVDEIAKVQEGMRGKKKGKGYLKRKHSPRENKHDK